MFYLENTIIIQMPISKFSLTISTILSLITISNTQNYIQCGSFNDPPVRWGSYITGSLTGWRNKWVDVVNFYHLGYGQAIDMQRGIGQNGYIEQNITLPVLGVYNLSFYQRTGANNDLSSSVMEVYWNNVLISIQAPNSTLVTFHSFEVVGESGSGNIVKFNEIGVDTDYFGMLLDQVSLALIRVIPPNSTTNTTTNTPTNNTTNSPNNTNVGTNSSIINSSNNSPTNTTNNTNISTNNSSSINNNTNSINYTTNSSITNTTTNTAENLTFNNTNNNAGSIVINSTVNSTNYNQSGDWIDVVDHRHPSIPITNIQLEQQPITVRNIKYAASVVFSLPVNHIAGLRYLYLFAEDLWLYNYDKAEYEGAMRLVFNSSASIESFKFNFFESRLHWREYCGTMGFSDYRKFTRQKFVNIEGSSSVLLNTASSFFLYTLPETLIFCLFLYCLFCIIQNYKISQYFRKYYFIKTVLLRTLLEGNIAYFIYVCFGHLAMPFTFDFYDRLSLSFTVVFLWVLLVFSLIFYPLIGRYLQNKAGHFLYCYYRCNSGYLMIASKNLIRNFLRGAVFYFFHENPKQEMFLLIAIQLAIIAMCVVVESTQKIFMAKIFYVLWILYHFLFVLLNFSLYLGYIYFGSDLKPLVLELQNIIVSLLVFTTLIILIFGMIPDRFLKPQKIQKKVTNDNEEKKSQQNHGKPETKNYAFISQIETVAQQAQQTKQGLNKFFLIKKQRLAKNIKSIKRSTLNMAVEQQQSKQKPIENIFTPCQDLVYNAQIKVGVEVEILENI